MNSNDELDMHRAETNAHRSVSKLRDSLNDLATKIDKPSRRAHTVRRGIDKGKELPWRQIAMAVGAIFVVRKIRNYFKG